MIPVRRAIIIGFGNPGRLDDGLGPALVERLQADAIANADLTANYQLVVEDAQRIAGYDLVVFADATVSGTDSFYCEAVEPDASASFTSHSVSPGQVLYLAQTLFKAKLEAYVIGMRGYEFNEFGERLSERAQANLAAAAAFLMQSARNNWCLEIHKSCHDKACPKTG